MKLQLWFALVILATLAVMRVGTVKSQEIYAGGYPQQSGEEIYKAICQGCHMPDAKGASAAGAYPALAGNVRLIAQVYPINVVVNGQRAMPPFGADLSDDQIANVVNYVRTHFGNHYKDTVSASAVKAARR